MFKKRSDKKELMDDLQIDEPSLEKNLKEIEFTNRWLGSRKTLIRALEILYKSDKQKFQDCNFVLADLGCGSGDLLRVIRAWAGSKQLKLQLIGIDANPFMINYARSKSELSDFIQYQQHDVLSAEFKKLQFDIITLNSFCHHFNNDELPQLLMQLQQQCKLAIIINDLHRHWLPFFGIKWLSFLGNFSSLAQHDGPLSILRAFKKNELDKIMQQASIKSYRIIWKWLFRWQVIICCKNSKQGTYHDCDNKN